MFQQPFSQNVISCIDAVISRYFVDAMLFWLTRSTDFPQKLSNISQIQMLSKLRIWSCYFHLLTQLYL